MVNFAGCNLSFLWFCLAFCKFNLLLKTTSFLGVTGRVQSEQGVVHVIADSFWQPSISSLPTAVASHDFH